MARQTSHANKCLRMCLKKFGQLPPGDVRKKIEQLNISQIDELGEKLLAADRPEELGLVD